MMSIKDCVGVSDGADASADDLISPEPQADAAKAARAAEFEAHKRRLKSFHYLTRPELDEVTGHICVFGPDIIAPNVRESTLTNLRNTIQDLTGAQIVSDYTKVPEDIPNAVRLVTATVRRDVRDPSLILSWFLPPIYHMIRPLIKNSMMQPGAPEEVKAYVWIDSLQCHLIKEKYTKEDHDSGTLGLAVNKAHDQEYLTTLSCAVWTENMVQISPCRQAVRHE